MTGVVLAGGEGTRLRPLTNIVNKHLLPVYDRPMIDYPIKTLRDMGCDDIVIVSGGGNIGGFAEYLGEGYTYRVQSEAGGIAQALKCAKGLVSGVFPVILGDNYFDTAPEMPTKPSIFTKWVKDPERFGVYSPLKNKITEKPKLVFTREDVAMGNDVAPAVLGLYVYDERVFDMIDTLKPSERGEYEITDINNLYLELGAKAIEYSGYWSDMGTFKSLLEVANYVEQL